MKKSTMQCGTNPSFALEQTCRVQNPDIPRAGRGRAAHSAAAEPGQDGPEGTSMVDPARKGRSGRETTPSVAIQRIENTVLGGTKPAVDQRFTSGSSAVYPRLFSGTKSALRSWVLTRVRRLLSLYTRFMQGMSGNKYKPAESKTRTYHRRVGAGRRTARRQGQARPGQQGRRHSGLLGRHLSLASTRAPRTPVLYVSSEARTHFYRTQNLPGPKP